MAFESGLVMLVCTHVVAYKVTIFWFFSGIS